MSEKLKPCRLEEFVGKKVRVQHPRFSGVGILKRVEPCREAIAWVELEHGEDRWYEASTVLPLEYQQKPMECIRPADPVKQALAEALEVLIDAAYCSAIPFPAVIAKSRTVLAEYKKERAQ